MRAITIREPGGPEVLQLVDRPVPTPGRGEVRVRVHAAGVNRADLLQRMGLYPPPKDAPQDIPGMEYAGEVDALGDGDVDDLERGDRVFGLIGGGAYAEYLVAPARALARIPRNLGYSDAAALPEGCITAYDAMVTQAHLRGGETVLIHAVGSGVGTIAVQLTRALGATSIGTARSQEKLDRCRPLGLDHGVLPASGKFAEAVRKLGAPHVVLDLVGGDYLEESLRCVAVQARVVMVGLTAGVRAQLDLGALLHHRVHVIGTVIRARPIEEKIALHRTFAREVVPLIARGAVRPVVDAVLPLERAAEAHERMGKNETFGKIVLTT